MAETTIDAEREVLSWSLFGTASRELAQTIADNGYAPDLILSVGRDGLLVAGSLGYAFAVKDLAVVNVEFYPGVDQLLEMPMMPPPVPQPVDPAGARVLAAEDVADTGATLRLIKDFCAELYEQPHTTVTCEYVWRRTAQWINFPWSTDPPVVAATNRDA